MTQLNPLRPRQVRFARAVTKGGNVARSPNRRLCGCISAYVQYSRLLKLSQGINSHQPTPPPWESTVISGLFVLVRLPDCNQRMLVSCSSE
jgi:hypothetical protein